MLSQPFLPLLLALYAAVTPVAAEEAPCTAHDGDDYFDLSSLSSSKDYQTTSPDGHDFVLNVCKPVNSETWAPNVEHPENVGGFSRHERGDFSIGNANTTLLIRDGHPLLIMMGGSRCPNTDSMTATTAIRFVCDTSVYGSGNPQLIAELPPEDDTACAFFFEWRTHVACPTHEKTGYVGFLTVIAALLVTGFMLYILLGTFYNRYVLELRGFDQIPRVYFSFTDISDCFQQIRNRFSGFAQPRSVSGTRNGSDGYRGLSEEEQGMLTGPPGFLDEQDDEGTAQGDHENLAVRLPPGMNSEGIIRL